MGHDDGAPPAAAGSSGRIEGMNGAESLVRTLLASGVEVCFANPGTSEMHFVAALDRIPGMRCVLGLQENVVTGAADGYWRIAGKPAATLLHCGPGLANGLANLHNARRARSGIVNCVGDQATYHRPLDAPLTADTEGLARTVSAWVRTATSAQTVGSDAAVAVQHSHTAPGGIATLVLPSDTCWTDGGVPAQPLPVPRTPAPDPQAIAVTARVLRTEPRVLVLLGGPTALTPEAMELAHRIVRHTGADVMAEGFNATMPTGRGRLTLERVPYANAEAVHRLERYQHVVLVGAGEPVGFFGYPGRPSKLCAPGAQFTVLTRPEQDAVAALSAVADDLGAPVAPIPDPGPPTAPPTGAPTSEGVGRLLASLVPEDAIVVDEAVSFGRNLTDAMAQAAPHVWLRNCGGAIGFGIPQAVGAAIAGGGRRVIALQADGSGMYTVQGLWTQAREQLPITTIVLSNRKYQILLGEYRGVGAQPGPTAMRMLDLVEPHLDWVHLANGMGVEAAATDTLEGLADLMAASLARPGPFVIELQIAG
jgi:acetolactate synthase-1/2/3 large subunit